MGHMGKFAKTLFPILITLLLMPSCNKDKGGNPVEPDFLLAEVTNPATDVALVLANGDNERLVVLADKTSEGAFTTLKGGAYVNPDGGTFTYWLGADGLPEFVITDNWLFRFYNYTNNTVDIIGIDPTGGWNHWLDVSVSASALDSMRNFTQSGLRGQPHDTPPWRSGSVMSAGDAAFNWAKAIRVVSFGISVTGCAIGIITAPTGAGAVLAGVACGGAIVGGAALLTDNDILGGGSTAVSTFTCALGEVGGCASLGLEIIAVGVEQAEAERDRGGALTDFNLRITLTWGLNPDDLDSHLFTPAVEGSSYHVYYSSPGQENAPPYAQLDVDDVTSYGPENITIKRLYSGTYYYSVYHFSGSGTITSSNARVRIHGPNGNVTHSFNVPSGPAGSNWWWNVFRINGSTGAISIINQISSSPSGVADDVQESWAPKVH